MHAAILKHREAIAALCHRYGVKRLEVFGSAARGDDFDPRRSDADFLVEFTPATRFDASAFLGLREGLRAALGRDIDLIDHAAVDASRNYIRRRDILADAQPIFSA